MEKIEWGKNIKVIDSFAFSGCKGLKTLTFLEGLSGIGQRAFAACRALKELYLPDSVTSLYISAFENCTNLEKKESERVWNIFINGRFGVVPSLQQSSTTERKKCGNKPTVSFIGKTFKKLFVRMEKLPIRLYCVYLLPAKLGKQNTLREI